MTTETQDPRQILRHCAEQALKHLDDPGADTDTIARQMVQTAQLVARPARETQQEPVHQ